MYKKYRRAINAVDCIDTVLAASSLGMGAVGVGLLSTIIAAPVVVALEAAAVACGLAGIAGKYISRRLLVKAKKHDEIRVLALSKLNSITDVISNALRDGRISPEEFKLVLDEIDKYGLMKVKIQEKTRKAAQSGAKHRSGKKCADGRGPRFYNEGAHFCGVKIECDCFARFCN